MRADFATWFGLFIFRIFNTAIVTTYFEPDEYWQSLEPAHRLVFGYGYLTWDWREKLRSWSFPLFYAAVYQLLRLAGLGDSTTAIIYGPRVLQAFISSTGDLYTIKLARKYFGNQAAKWALLLTTTSWFNFAYGARTHSNSLEAVLTTIALYHWPVISGGVKGWTKRAYISAIGIVGLCCMIRPSAAINWIFPGLYLLFSSPRKVQVILITAVAIATALAAIVLIDSYCYGSFFTITPLTFLKYNIFDDISSFYGMSQWHFYLFSAVPTMAFSALPIILFGAWRARKTMSWLAFNVIAVITINSLPKHKEIRFIHLVLPMLFVYGAHGLQQLELDRNNDRVHSPATTSQNGDRTEKGSRRTASPLLPLTLAFIVITNAAMAFYLCRYHQSGVVRVVDQLRVIADEQAASKKSIKVSFWMPCHSTPFYAYLHRDIPMTFLTCNPPVALPMDRRGEYLDEADLFYLDPAKYILSKHLLDGQQHQQDDDEEEDYIHSSPASAPAPSLPPSHIVLYEGLLQQRQRDAASGSDERESSPVAKLLQDRSYSECHRFFNTHFSPDSRRSGDVLIYCQQ